MLNAEENAEFDIHVAFVIQHSGLHGFLHGRTGIASFGA
jgi:hypothetical protein